MVGIKKYVYLDRETLKELCSVHTPYTIKFKQLDIDLHKIFRKQCRVETYLNLMMEDMENL